MCKLFVLIIHSTSSKGEQSKRLLSSIPTWVVAKGQRKKNRSKTTAPFFWLYHAACGILVPPPGIEPLVLAMEAQSTNHWTAGEILKTPFLYPLHICAFSHLVQRWWKIGHTSQCYPRNTLEFPWLNRSTQSGLRGHWGPQQTVTVSDMWINANEP